MCGIVSCVRVGEGSWDAGSVEKEVKGGLEQILHRGPDGTGIWSDDRCVLGHCRLSINDLTPTGDQPLHSHDSSLHAIVNGEIYYDESERTSLNYPFTGRSDSELVLALYKAHGLEFLSRLRGEYALILYDSKADLVIAARDRYGIKPLFWRLDEKNHKVWFGAEVKAFLGDTAWEPEWDVDAISSGGWGQDTRTLFKGVQKLRPGHYMSISKGERPVSQPYWDIDYPSIVAKETRTEEEMINDLRTHLVDSVRYRLRADVPVGIYLSGGIDSSALAGIANYLVRHEGVKMGSLPPDQAICCFSIAFDAESGVDESSVAENTAKHLGVKYLTTHMSEQALADSFVNATWHIEHHNHDCNYIGKYVLSRLPRENGYKVVLTGEGADEQFGGYPLFLPDFLRREDPSSVHGAVEVVKKSYEIIGGDSRYFDQDTRGLLPYTTPSAMASFTPNPSLFHQIPTSPLQTISSNIPAETQDRMKGWHPLHSAQYIWQKGHLSNQFLSCLGDRVEMAHSVEARTPFLDHHLTQFVNSLPASIKIRKTNDGYVEKYALREAVKPFVTEEVYGRRKHAYTAPTTFPLEGPIHRLMQGIITEQRVDGLGFIRWEEVQRLWTVAFEPGDEHKDQGEEMDLGAKTWAWRQLIMIAQWVVLGERFGIKRAT